MLKIDLELEGVKKSISMDKEQFDNSIEKYLEENEGNFDQIDFLFECFTELLMEFFSDEEECRNCGKCKKKEVTEKDLTVFDEFSIELDELDKLEYDSESYNKKKIEIINKFPDFSEMI